MTPEKVSSLNKERRTALQDMDEPTTNKQARDKRKRNPLKHGLRSGYAVRATSLGGMPKGASYVGKLVQQLRGQLEALVLEMHGEVALVDACRINTACRWERHALLATRWLKIHAATFNHDQRLNYSREIAKASENRDKAIAALRLQTNPQSVIAALYAPRIPTEVTEDDGSN